MNGIVLYLGNEFFYLWLKLLCSNLQNFVFIQRLTDLGFLRYQFQNQFVQVFLEV